MIFKELILKNRSYRRFEQSHKIDASVLKELVDLARLSPSAANLQPLKYILSCDSEKNDEIFPHLGWAAYLKDWGGPAQGERPSAYIIILRDSDIAGDVKWGDHSIVAHSMLLGAVEKGLGGCMIGNVNKPALQEALKIPERYEILLVAALGKPAEDVIIDDVGEEGNIRYWRDEKDVHHVPKRSLDDIILDI